MTDAPKYDRGDEPGLDVEVSNMAASNEDGSPRPGTGYEVELSGECWFETREDAERARQEYALAIADRVHGDELARLREVEDTWMDLVRRMREVIIHTLSDCKAANLALTDRFAIEVFDEASIAVGLAISNDDGVPFELLRFVTAFKPTMATVEDVVAGKPLYVVRYGADDGNWSASHDLATMSADFGERYAAWKAGQR